MSTEITKEVNTMEWKKGRQIIKTRDDQTFVVMDRDPSSEESKFSLRKDTICSWASNENGQISGKNLRKRIEPWLTALVQSEHFSLLIGSGLTHAVHAIGKKGRLPGMQQHQFRVFDQEISKRARRTACAANRQDGNFEDQLRAANELLAGLEILSSSSTSDGCVSDSQIEFLREGILNVMDSFTASILHGERSLVSLDQGDRERAFNYLVGFLMSFASRAVSRERLHIFTTNYDRYIEAGADVAGLRLVDRFVGTLTPVFRASRLAVDLHYNSPGIRGEPRYLEGVARFTKLHGSIDWVDSDRAIRRIGLPFGARTTEPYFGLESSDQLDARCLMIYPNSAKDRETTYYPYVELFRDFAAAICRPNSVLVCYGYGFGDEHINRVIADMLTIPSTHLVVISYDDSLGRIRGFCETLGRHAQTSLLLGDHVADLRTLVDRYLPKAAIDRITIRMADLLKTRLSSDMTHADSASKKQSDENLVA